MEYTYRNVHSFDGTISNYSIKRNDNAVIPFDPANTDYAEYLRWLDAGNTPLPSDSVANESTTNQGA